MPTLAVIDHIPFFWLAVISFLCFQMWTKTEEEAQDRMPVSLWLWFSQGLFAPLICWIVLNAGAGSFAPLFPEAALIWQSSPRPWTDLMEITRPGMLVIITYWGAATMLWLLSFVATRVQSWKDLAVMTGFWTVVTSPFMWIAFASAGWFGLGAALLLPVCLSLFFSLPLLERRINLPNYSRATANLKFGRYESAEQAVIEELEKKEDDFEGWMVLAELYATRDNDLDQAEKTIGELCDQPNLSPFQISLALNRLADWQLNLRQDPDGARRALSALCYKLPETHYARMAEQRFGRLPATRDELLQQRQPKTFKMSEAPRNISEADLRRPGALTEEEARHWEEILLEKAQGAPDDLSARESLAFLYTLNMNRPEDGLKQITIASEHSAVSSSKRAEWLSLMAYWQETHLGDVESAIATLRRLTNEHPRSKQAFTARSRIALLEHRQKAAAQAG